MSRYIKIKKSTYSNFIIELDNMVLLEPEALNHELSEISVLASDLCIPENIIGDAYRIIFLAWKGLEKYDHKNRNLILISLSKSKRLLWYRLDMFDDRIATLVEIPNVIGNSTLPKKVNSCRRHKEVH